MTEVIVRRMATFNSKRWGVYTDGVLQEGGFFGLHAAETAARSVARDLMTALGDDTCTIRIKGLYDDDVVYTERMR